MKLWETETVRPTTKKYQESTTRPFEPIDEEGSIEAMLASPCLPRKMLDYVKIAINGKQCNNFLILVMIVMRQNSGGGSNSEKLVEN
jgi:hypothetical protein